MPLLEQLMNNASGAAATQNKDTKDAHKFWSTQPVPDFGVAALGARQRRQLRCF